MKAYGQLRYGLIFLNLITHVVRGQLHASAVVTPANMRLGSTPEPIYIDPLEKRQTCPYRKLNYVSSDVQPTIQSIQCPIHCVPEAKAARVRSRPLTAI